MCFFTSLKFLPALGNLPNYIFVVIMVIGTVYWLRLQKNYSEEAQEKGTLE